MKVRLISPANDELDEAVKYYDYQLPGLGFRFFQEVGAAINRILFLPEAWTKIGERTRRCYLKSFPYALLYTVEPEEILITAVANLHRNPESYKGDCFMKIQFIEARDLPDLWFQAVYQIIENGRKFKIDRGSYSGQERLEYDYFIGQIKFPGTQPLLPDIPASCGIPNPVEEEYILGGKNYQRSYIEYIMTGHKEPGESYTYGERLTKAPITGAKKVWWDKGDKDIIDKREIDGKIIFEEDGRLYLNQIEWIIDTYKRYGQRNNQMVLQVGHPSDLTLLDPPCLRSIDTRIQDGKLNFFVYFRSWDLWGGMPANLAGIQFLKEYMAGEVGVDDGEMIVESKGLHLYGYAEDLAKLRCMKE